MADAVAETTSDGTIQAIDLRTADDSSLAATGAVRPLLTWRLRSFRPGTVQQAYKIHSAADPGFEHELSSSGVVADSRPWDAPLPGPVLRSREVRWWRVRVLTDVDGQPIPNPARGGRTLTFPSGEHRVVLSRSVS